MIDTLLTHPLVLVLAVLVTVLGVGRVTRLITYDDYPPSAAFRSWWIRRVTHGNGWAKLADCYWCASPWVTAVCLLWFLAIPLAAWIGWAWWLFWGWLALAYVASMIVARDEPADQSED